MHRPHAHIEDHYELIPPGTIHRVAGQRRLALQPAEDGPAFRWGYAGSGPNATARALLIDATGSCDQDLAIAFTRDHLDWWSEIGDKPFVLTVCEVRAWRAQTEPRVRADRASRRHGNVVSFAQLRERFEQQLRETSARPWWQTYRQTHGQPRI